MQNFTEGIESLHCVFRWRPVAQDLDNLRAKDVSNRLAPRLALLGGIQNWLVKLTCHHFFLDAWQFQSSILFYFSVFTEQILH